MDDFNKPMISRRAESIEAIRGTHCDARERLMADGQPPQHPADTNNKVTLVQD